MLTTLLLASALAAPCPDGDRLAGRRPVAVAGVEEAARLTDGEALEEGSAWTARGAVAIPEGARVAWDLGEPVRLDAVFLQADHNDAYAVEGSADGASWAPLGVAEAVSGGGLRTRRVAVAGTVRWLAVRPEAGDGRYAVSEVQAFCGPRDAWDARVVQPADGSGTGPRRVAAWGRVLAGGLALLAWALARREDTWGRVAVLPALGAVGLAFAFARGLAGMPAVVVYAAIVAGLAVLVSPGRASLRQHAQVSWAAVMLVGLLAWPRFGDVHDGKVVHRWDQLHYVLGARWFDQVGHDGLYDCLAAAELADGRETAVWGRPIRDLTTNALVRGDDRRRGMGACVTRFDDADWDAFRHDARLFRQAMGLRWYGDALKDHGVNVTPFWVMIAGSAASWGHPPPPPDKGVPTARAMDALSPEALHEVEQQWRLDQRRFRRALAAHASWDLLLLAGLFLGLSAGFGLETAALAALVLGVGWPWVWDWTGGSFLRMPWLTAAGLGLATLHRERGVLGGALLAISALLRGFPGVLLVALVPPALAGGRTARRALVAGAVTLGLGVGLSSLAVGPTAWPDFLANTAVHQDTPLTNDGGWPAFVAHDPAATGALARTDDLDPFAAWKQGQRDRRASRAPLVVAGWLATLAFLGWRGRRLTAAEAASAGVLLVVMGFRMTSYYHVALLLLAPLATRRAASGLALGAGALATNAAFLLPLGSQDTAHVYATGAVLAGAWAAAVWATDGGGAAASSADDPGLTPARGGDTGP